jgi:2-polyprenyl-3-methyl-5-hydroxy-6-metoxy-1,4-benzoquinol methylase
MSFVQAIRRRLRPLNVADYTRRLVDAHDCKVAVDIGCGSASHLSHFRPKILTVGIDAFPDAIARARANGVHDHYIVADILKTDLSEILLQIEQFGPVDIVSLYEVIEHFPKSAGFEILERCEQLTRRFVILETPNGFVEQGPEFGNEFQRHLSGWYIHDFAGRGYKVFGTTGTRYLREYAAGPKYNFPGCILLDEFLTFVLRINRHPQHAYNLVAIKDVRGAPARLGAQVAHATPIGDSQ